MDESKEDLFDSRRLTLKGLKAERHSLSRQILLAVRLHDSVGQAGLEEQMAELQEKIVRSSPQEYRWGEDRRRNTIKRKWGTTLWNLFWNG